MELFRNHGHIHYYFRIQLTSTHATLGPAIVLRMRVYTANYWSGDCRTCRTGSAAPALKEFCDLYRKAKHVPNISQLALTGLPSGIGKKGNQVNRKRKREPENERILLSKGHTPDVSRNQTAPSLERSFTRSHPRPTTDVNQPGPSTIQSVSLRAQSGASTCNASPQSYCLLYQGLYSSFSPQISAWSTHSGDINVYRPPFNPSPLHTTPPTQASDFAFRLCFRAGNISVCNGCRGRFDKHAESPHNLCVQHEEWRSNT